MILRRRTVELLTDDCLPDSLRGLVDQVIVLDGLPCSTIATRAPTQLVMTVGRDRATALCRLAERVRGV